MNTFNSSTNAKKINFDSNRTQNPMRMTKKKRRKRRRQRLTRKEEQPLMPPKKMTRKNKIDKLK